METLAPHALFVLRNRVHVEQVFALSDHVADADHTGGTVYRCIEGKCEGLPVHSHSRRPYLMYDHERLLCEK